jgi:1,4-alpha-glucan branching enzyme
MSDPHLFPSTFGDLDLQLLGEGTHYQLYDKLGVHPTTVHGVMGTVFAVWAPNAARVSVVGDFNHWDGRRHSMRRHAKQGVWEVFVRGVGEGERYKLEILSSSGTPLALKADPVAFAFEAEEPRTASVVCQLDGNPWGDAAWVSERGRRQALDRPLAI